MTATQTESDQQRGQRGQQTQPMARQQGKQGQQGQQGKQGGGITAKLAQLRERYVWLDRLIRMNEHYTRARGNHLAGAITYFSFLSLFPMLAIAFAVLSYVVRYYPDARTSVEQFLSQNLPGLVGPGGIDTNAIAAGGGARISAGLVGAAGLLYAGLGWLDALRESLRQMWAVEPSQGNIVVKKIKDVIVLLLLGTAVIITTAGSSLATNATTSILELVGLGSSGIASFFLQVFAIVVAVLVNTVLLTIIFARLPGHRMPIKNMLGGALLAAIVIEILKQFATTIIASSQGNPVYGTFAAAISILVWFNFMARVVMYGAAWCVVGPVPTLEAKVAAEGETLDGTEAAAASEARERRGDDADVPMGEPYKTTAGAVPVTTSGAGHPSGDGAAGGMSREQAEAEARRRANGGKPARPNGGFPSFAGVVALLAVRRKAQAQKAAAEQERAGV